MANNNSTMVIVGVAVGALVLGGGAAFAIAYMLKKKDAEPQPSLGTDSKPQVNIVNVPDRIIGRPFGDPFYPHFAGSNVWGSGPWAYRSPRVSPVTPRFFHQRDRR